MTWPGFYLICFVVGLTFSLLSFFAGGVRWHLHLPHLFHGHVALGHGSVAHAGTGKGGAHGQGGQVSPFNFVTLAAFLAWFGGTGYLLSRYWTVWFVMGLGIALGSGFIGAGIIYLFLSRVLISQAENLDPSDYDMVGVLGRTSVSIRADGTGEIIYSQAGTRQTCGARSEDHAAIPKGAEVIVTRYDKGIAYVRLWTEMAGEEANADSAAKH